MAEERPPAPRYMNQHETAVYTRTSERTLERMRVRGGGPAYSRIGRRVVYDRAAVDQWIAANRHANTSQEVA